MHFRALKALPVSARSADHVTSPAPVRPCALHPTAATTTSCHQLHHHHHRDKHADKSRLSPRALSLLQKPILPPSSLPSLPTLLVCGFTQLCSTSTLPVALRASNAPRATSLCTWYSCSSSVGAPSPCCRLARSSLARVVEPDGVVVVRPKSTSPPAMRMAW
jgi:hypothetical protein